MKLITCSVTALLSIGVFCTSASASELEYFIGGDIGVHHGKSVYEENGVKERTDLKDDPILGIHGGFVLNKHHRFTVGGDYKAFNLDGADASDAEELATAYLEYDYLFPITSNVSLSVGPRVGYEKFTDDDAPNDLNGMVYGGQAGLEYRSGHWGFGGDVIYLHHDAEFDKTVNGVNYKSYIDDETQLKLNAQYYF